MEAGLPGIPGFEMAYNGPAWHFRFNGPTPEALVNGRERIYFEHFWNDFAADKDRSVSEADRVIYTEAYSRPGRLHASWEYLPRLPASRKGLRRVLQDEAEDARPGDRRGEGEREPAEQASALDSRLYLSHAQGHRPLAAQRAASGNDRSSAEVPVISDFHAVGQSNNKYFGPSREDRMLFVLLSEL
jgi:hypothetical protein